MHELSIAQSIVEAVGQQVAAHGGGRVLGVSLRVGALSGVDVQALRFVWDVATADTPMAGAGLEIEEVPLVAFCLDCQAERELPGIQSLRCPACGELMPQIVRGRELELLSIEVADEEEAAADTTPAA